MSKLETEGFTVTAEAGVLHKVYIVLLHVTLHSLRPCNNTLSKSTYNAVCNTTADRQDCNQGSDSDAMETGDDLPGYTSAQLMEHTTTDAPCDRILQDKLMREAFLWWCVALTTKKCKNCLVISKWQYAVLYRNVGTNNCSRCKDDKLLIRRLLRKATCRLTEVFTQELLMHQHDLNPAEKSQSLWWLVSTPLHCYKHAIETWATQVPQRLTAENWIHFEFENPSAIWTHSALARLNTQEDKSVVKNDYMVTWDSLTS